MNDNAQTRPSILFLDDEDAILSSLRSLFRREGYVLNFFHAGREALAFLEQHPVDVIVTDMRMPEITGAEFLQRAMHLRPGAARIMLSGHEDKGVVIKALADGLAQYYVLKPWDDDALRALVKEAMRLQQTLHNQKLKEALASVATLPSVPKHHVHLMEILSKEGNSINDIVEEIEASPPLVAKLLHVANSVYVASRNPITTVREAAIFVGVQYIASLVTAIEAFQSVTKKLAAEYSHIAERIWNESLRRATVAKMIGTQWNGFNNGHLSYVASLLQDIGYVLWLTSDSKKYIEFMHGPEADGFSQYEREVIIFGMHHDEVGAALLEFWNFPQEIVTAVARHHQCAEQDPLSLVIQLAEALVCNDPANPHDPVIDELIAEWRTKLDQKLAPVLQAAYGG